MLLAVALHEDVEEVAAGAALEEPELLLASGLASVSEGHPVDVGDVPLDAGLYEADRLDRLLGPVGREELAVHQLAGVDDWAGAGSVASVVLRDEPLRELPDIDANGPVVISVQVDRRCVELQVREFQRLRELRP